MKDYEIIKLKIVPAHLKIRDPFEVEVMVLNSTESRTKGFQGVSPFDATIPYLFQFYSGSQRTLHNSNVNFPVKALMIGHKNMIVQEIVLKEGDATNTLTRPCRFLLEIPEPIFDNVTIEVGDTVLGLPLPL
jgi:uncharacterized membrane protein (UPF0127 family)